MTINVDLLDRTMAHIEANPEQWNQLGWRREKTMCFAARAADLAGGTWASPAVNGSVSSGYLIPEPGDGFGDRDELGHVHVMRRAQRLLGFNHVQVRKVFYANAGDLDNLRRIVAEVRASAGGEA